MFLVVFFGFGLVSSAYNGLSTVLKSPRLRCGEGRRLSTCPVITGPLILDRHHHHCHHLRHPLLYHLIQRTNKGFRITTIPMSMLILNLDNQHKLGRF